LFRISAIVFNIVWTFKNTLSNKHNNCTWELADHNSCIFLPFTLAIFFLITRNQRGKKR
jgi:hypothetical protein